MGAIGKNRFTSYNATRKNTSGSTTIKTGECLLTKILVGKTGDFCVLTVYDDTTVMFNALLDKNHLPEIECNIPILTSLKVALTPPACVAHYKCNDTGPPGSNAQVVLDSSGNGNDAEGRNFVNDSSQSTKGRIAGALELNGTTQYIIVPDGVLEMGGTDGSKPWSIACWVYHDSYASDMPVFGRKVGAAGVYCTFRADAPYAYITVYGYDSSAARVILRAYDNFDEDNKFVHDRWKHVVITADGTGSVTGIKIYVNGYLRSGTTERADIDGDWDNDEPIWFGRYNTTYHDGRFDDIRLYQKELSLEEIAWLYNLNEVPNAGPTMGVGRAEDFEVADITVCYED